MKKFTIICLIILSFQAYSQQKIQLIDKENGNPISFAHFLYQTQRGSSSLDGWIQIQYIKDEDLFISHINYGKIKISVNELNKAIKSGKLYLQQTYISLMPTTVIARKPDRQSENLNLNVSDKLSHDAGDFLGQTALISGIRKSGNYGFDPVMRGFKYDQITIILDDGMSATAACPNRMDPPISQIPLNMVEKVEIIKGPHSLRYGNSFGGSIHFKSSQEIFSPIAKAFGRTTGSYESNGNIFRSEAHAGIKGKFYNLGFYGAYSEGNNYKDGIDNEVASDFNRRNLGLSGSIKISKKQNIRFKANSNYAQDVDFPALNMDLREDNTKLFSFSHKIRFVKSVLASISTSANASFVDHTMDNLGKDLNPRMVNAITKAKTKNFALRSEAAFQFRNSSLFTGIDFKSEQAEGTRSREMLMGPMAGKIFLDNIWQDSKIDKLGVFAEYHRNFNETFIVLSGRLEQNLSESRDVDPNFIGVNPKTKSDKTNLSLSMGATKELGEQWRLGLWFGRAARSGSISERYINYLPVDIDPYERIGNPGLQSEINYQIDFNINWTKKDYKLDINLFNSWLRNYISSEIRADLNPKLASAPGVKQFVNIQSAAMRGFEINLRHNLNQSIYHQLNLAYTYGENTELNEALPEISPLELRYTLGLHLCKQKFNPEINFRYAAEQNRISKSYGESKSPDFAVVDCKANYRLSKQIQLNGGIRNIFDTAYYEHLSRSVKGIDNRAIYAPGRSFYATISYKF